MPSSRGGLSGDLVVSQTCFRAVWKVRRWSEINRVEETLHLELGDFRMNVSGQGSLRTFALVLTLLALAGCSRSGSRVNGTDGGTVVQPPAPNQAPSVANLTLLGSTDPLTGVINNVSPPFTGPVVFSYLLADAEGDPLDLRVEFARASDPTNFQLATLVGMTNPIAGLTSDTYANVDTPPQFTWDAVTDLNAGVGGLQETVQFRITPIDPQAEGGVMTVGGGIPFDLPAAPNARPTFDQLEAAGIFQNNTVVTATTFRGMVAFNYAVSDAESDPVNISFQYQLPMQPNGALPPPIPMTLTRVNGGSPDPTSPAGVIENVPSANFTGQVIWDSLADLGTAEIQDITIIAQVRDAGGVSSNSTAQLVIPVGNPTAAFTPSVSVIGRQGNITLGFEVFDSDADAVTVVFEFSVDGGQSFAPITLTNPSAGTVVDNTLTAVPSSITGEATTVNWASGSDVPADAEFAILRVTVLDDDAAASIPVSTPDVTPAPGATPLPNLVLNAGQNNFQIGSLSFVSPQFAVAGPPTVVSVRQGVRDLLYAPTLQQGTPFLIEGENFGTDESLVTVLINDLEQEVVEADSNVIVARLSANVQTGLLRVIVNGVVSNVVPVLIRGEDYWLDATPQDTSDAASLPSVADPSVDGELEDIDGDGDLDLVIAQDGANSVLINSDLNSSFRTLKASPFQVTATTDRLVIYVVKTGISRNSGPYLTNDSDELNIMTIRQNAVRSPTLRRVTTTNFAVTDRATGPSFVETATGYVAAIANTAGTAQSTAGPSGRTFEASVLNRRRLEILPRLPWDRLVVFESTAGGSSARRPLGYSPSYGQGFGSSGTDQVTVTVSAGAFAVGEIVTNQRTNTTSTVARVQALPSGDVRLDLTVDSTIRSGDTLISAGGGAGTVTALIRNPGLRLGGYAIDLQLPQGVLVAADLVSLLNNAAVDLGLDVPGLTVTITADSTAALSVGATVTTQTGASGTVLEIIEDGNPNTDNIVRLSSSDAFRTGDEVRLNGTQVASVTFVRPARSDFLARQTSSGLGVEIVSKDVVVVGNGTANQPLGFVSTRLTSLQEANANGNWVFEPGFEDLVISIGEADVAPFTPITVPLSGTMTTAEIITAINNVGLPARLAGDMTAGVFEAALVDGRIELRTDDPTLSIHIQDSGAQRIIGFVGRFVKPHARGIGTYVDETSSRLMNQPNDFSTRVVPADFNEDGAPDLFFANAQEQNRLYLNDGRGNFTNVTATRLPSLQDETFGATAADLDNDGDLDLVLANRARNRVLENRTGDMTGGGTLFAAATLSERSGAVFDVNVEASTLKISSDVEARDFDGDGRLDLVFANLTRANGTGPFLFFNRFDDFSTSTAVNPKFTTGSGVFRNQQPLIQKSQRFRFDRLRVGTGSTGLENFSVEVGDINADEKLDLVIGSNATGFIELQNKAYVQTSNTITVEIPNVSGLNVLKFDGLFLAGENVPSATVLEVIDAYPANVPAQNGGLVQTFELSSLPAGYTVGTQLQTVPGEFSTNILFTTDDGMGNIRVAITFVNPLRPGDVVELVTDDGMGNLTAVPNSQTRIVSIALDTQTGTDRLELVNPGGFVAGAMLRLVVPTVTILDRGLEVFVERTQQPLFSNSGDVPVTNPRWESPFDYPDMVSMNGGFVRRLSDVTKDMALRGLNGRFVPGSQFRTPESAPALLEPLDADGTGLGGGGQAFARFCAVANGLDRTTSPTGVTGNAIFVGNDGLRSKNSPFNDALVPFYFSPFIVQTDGQGDPRSHSATDTSETFGCAFEDIDNDGDLDVVYFNGGGQGQSAQNQLQTARFAPPLEDNLTAAYP